MSAGKGIADDATNVKDFLTTTGVIAGLRDRIAALEAALAEAERDRDKWASRWAEEVTVLEATVEAKTRTIETLVQERRVGRKHRYAAHEEEKP